MKWGMRALAAVLVASMIAMVAVAILVLFVSEEYDKWLPVTVWFAGMSSVSLSLAQREVKE